MMKILDTIILLGKGRLIELIYKAYIQANYINIIRKESITEVKELLNNNVSKVCIISDVLDLQFIKDVEKVMPTGIYYTCIFSIFENVLITPLKTIDEDGCIECIFQRWAMTKKDRFRLFSIRSEFEGKMSDVESSHYTNLLADLIVEIMCKQDGLSKKVYIINKENFSYSENYFLPVSSCFQCESLEIDTKDVVEKEFEEIFKLTNTKKYRKYDMSYFEEKLEKYYLNNQIGLFNFLLDDIDAPFAVSVANLPIMNGKDEVGVGRTNNYKNARITALLEGLERYCGMQPGKRKASIYTSYDEISEQALNPVTIGLHTKEQYDASGVNFRKYSSDMKLNWVWGYSLSNRKCLLIPETIAYYGINIRDREVKNFVYEISNGCALGGSLIEAILYGLFEVIERDAFLITWYTKMPLPQITDIKNKTINLMIEKFQYEFQYDLYLFDMTLDITVPGVLILAKNRLNDNRMNIMCAAGCHTNMEKAIETAIHELCDIMPALNIKFIKRHDELKKMYNNVELVTSMEDHSLLYGLREAEKDFDFLLKSNKVIENRKIDKLEYSGEPLKDLMKIIDQLRELKLNVIAVNQTAKELEKVNLHCVKVLIPGMLPMTFGHKSRRIHNLDRIFNVPKFFGHKISNEEEIRNNYVRPHPFP